MIWILTFLNKLLDKLLFRKLFKIYGWKRDSKDFYTKDIWNLHYNGKWNFDSHKANICGDRPLITFESLNKDSFETMEKMILIEQKYKEIM